MEQQCNRKLTALLKKFLKKFEKGDLGDSQDYLEWWGLIKGIKTLEERLKKAKVQRDGACRGTV